MAWEIKFDKGVERTLGKIDKPTAKRIVRKLRQIAELDNPRQLGKPLTGNLSGLWRYRVGDWRIICYLEDAELVVLVIGVDHRRQVYR
ncbi:type II toxin-antitoxin system RelE/ParE family toxin [Varibaculum cambriense]|uniref:type II toxin-antitoxin system RelE family toxin n=1 Tax=Varibaculum cambriense TaxID=184870 RepID=UPI00291214A2|nr:type II toxin-antitoxin system RelE/ParE family toxin [Varibaculum cambriense]MDU5542453.1 type II toxin-antitoxin system RelE/ParE family toxin [Varibaculum cambriense]